VSAGAFVGDMGLPSQSLCVPFLPIGGGLATRNWSGRPRRCGQMMGARAGASAKRIEVEAGSHPELAAVSTAHAGIVKTDGRHFPRP